MAPANYPANAFPKMQAADRAAHYTIPISICINAGPTAKATKMIRRDQQVSVLRLMLTSDRWITFCRLICRRNISNDILQRWTVDNNHVHESVTKLEHIQRSIASTHAIAWRQRRWRWSNYSRWHNIVATIQTNSDNGGSTKHNVAGRSLHTVLDKWTRSSYSVNIGVWQHKHRHLHKRSAATAPDDDVHVDAHVCGRGQTGLSVSISAAVSG